MSCCLIIKPFILSTSFHIGVEAQCIVQDPILRAALRCSVGWGEDKWRRQGKGTLAFSCHLSVSVPVETSLIWLVSSLKAIFSPLFLTTGSSRLAFSKVPLCPSQRFSCTSISSGWENPTSLVTSLEERYSLHLLNPYTYLQKVLLPSLPPRIGPRTGGEPQDSCSDTNNILIPLRHSSFSISNSLD